MMRLLEMKKRAYEFEQQKREHRWEQLRLLGRINQQKAAVLGTGGIGGQIAKRLWAFGADITGYNRSGRTKEYFHRVHIIDHLAEEIGQYDLIAIALPKDDSTVNLFNKDLMSKMKPTACFINVGRGGVVNEDDLYDILKEGKIAAAALDVYTQEPLSPECKLLELPNFYFSPHNSYSSEDNDEVMFAWMMENLLNYREGKPIKNVV